MHFYSIYSISEILHFIAPGLYKDSLPDLCHDVEFSFCAYLFRHDSIVAFSCNHWYIIIVIIPFHAVHKERFGHEYTESVSEGLSKLKSASGGARNSSILFPRNAISFVGFVGAEVYPKSPSWLGATTARESAELSADVYLGNEWSTGRNLAKFHVAEPIIVQYSTQTISTTQPSEDYRY